MSFSLVEDFEFKFSENALQPQLDITQAMSRLKEYSEASITDSNYGSIIYPQFHVLTADKWTANSTLYTYEAHKGKNQGLTSTGQYSFTQPFRIPLIEQHRVSDGNGLPASRVFGRMKDAKVIKNKETGKAHLAGLGEVADPQAIHELLSGIWLTGSLGSVCDLAHCSICGAVIANQNDLNNHPHRRGRFYRPAGRREQGTVDQSGFCEAESSERGAQYCGTAVKSYRAQEYSKVVVPSDNESVVTIPNITTSPGGYFSNESLRVPQSALWIPMKQSSSSGISELGERYVDLVTGKEVEATSIGLLSGIKLHEYIESGFSIQEEEKMTAGIHLPSMTFGQETFQEETLEEPIVQNEAIIPEAVTLKKEPTVFCGPDNSFPVNNAFEYKAALRFLGRYKGPGNKSQIKAYILRRGRKNQWAISPSSPLSNKETVKSMSTENEATCPYALKITIPLPAGAKSYTFLPRESAEERATSLVALESLDDLLASLEESDETSLRGLLTESASGSEDTMEIVINQENYLVLASLVDMLVESITPEEVTVAETVVTESAPAPAVDSLILQQLESMQAQIVSLMEAAATAALVAVEDKKPEHITAIHAFEAVLGLCLTDLADLESQTTEALHTYSTILSGLSGRKVAHVETPAEIEIKEDAHPDTVISEARVDNPLQGEQVINESVVAEELTDVNTTPITLADLSKIRKSIGSLVPSSLRRDLRRG